MDVMQFTQALSRIWVLETRLLDKSKIERMLESSTAEDTLKILGETEYANVMLTVKRATDYEDILSTELKRIYNLMYEISPVKSIVNLMSIKYNYHNLKVMLKGKFLNKDLSHMFINLGNEDLYEIKGKIDSGNYNDLKEEHRLAVEKVVADFEITKDPQRIDIIMDKYMFAKMVEIKNELKYPFVNKLVNAIIDSTNVKTLLRLKRQNKNRDFASEVMISGGAIDRDNLVALINESPENIIARLQSTIYSNMIKEGIEAYIATDSANLLEKLSDNYIMALMKDSKLVTFGPERIFSYIYAKETEIKIIRIIMVGKLNNIADEVIRERLRDIYV